MGGAVGNTNGLRHGHSGHTPDGKVWTSPTYKSWSTMKQRCLNPNAPNYARYGGRGITICPEWLGFDGFLAALGPRPEGMTLGRIDNDGPYEPSNCRWETWKQQNNNRDTTNLGTHPNSLANLTLGGGSRASALKAWETKRAKDK
jgi:hypothetical protein